MHNFFTYEKYLELVNAVRKFSFRDYLFLELIYYTSSSLSKILTIKKTDVDFVSHEITIHNKNEFVKIKIPKDLCDQLKNYITQTQRIRHNNDLLFLTNQGKKIYRTHYISIFNKISKKLNFEYTVTSKMIRFLLPSNNNIPVKERKKYCINKDASPLLKKGSIQVLKKQIVIKDEIVNLKITIQVD